MTNTNNLATQPVDAATTLQGDTAVRHDTDLVTVVQFQDCGGNPARANKRVWRNAAGGLQKEAPSNLSRGIAVTRRATDPHQLAEILEQVSQREDIVIILGFADGSIIDEPYQLLWTKRIAGAQNIGLDQAHRGWHLVDGQRTCARTLENFRHSSWILFDRDPVDGMPPDLQDQTRDQWWATMTSICPPLANAAVVFRPSTSGGIRVDGGPLKSAAGMHAFVQVQDPSDIPRFSSALLVRAHLAGKGFMRPWGIAQPDTTASRRAWSIYDPCVFSPERVVYDGKPVVEGDGLTFVPPEISLVDGVLCNTRDLLSPSEQERQRFQQLTGTRLVRDRRSDVVSYAFEQEVLDLGLVVETEQGEMTVEQFWRSDHDKLRAQAPFRPDSTSWAGFLGRHKDGTPFLFDIGIQTKYVVPQKIASAFGCELALKQIDRASTNEVLRDWTTWVRGLGAADTERVKQAVSRKTEVGARSLQSELTAAKREWEAERVAERVREAEAEAAESSRLSILWDEAKLGAIHQAVVKAMLADENHEPLMHYCGSLVRVAKAKPTTVRQVSKRHDLGEAYPDMWMVQEHNLDTIRLRMMQSCAFMKQGSKGEWREVKPEDVLVNTVLRALTDDVPSLTAVAEHPLVLLDGRLLWEPGLDRSTGLFMASPPLLTRAAKAAEADCSLAAAQASLKWLREELFAEFPFADDVAHDAAIAFLLTAAERRALTDSAPMFCVTAPVQGSGKTSVVQLISAILFGRPVGAASWPMSETELQKTLVGIFQDAQPIVLFDNVPQGAGLKSDELARATTSATYNARKLGVNDNLSLPTTTLFTFTGNNVTFSGDFATRVLDVRLIPKEESPDRRQFRRRDLEGWADEHRPEALQHLLTIVLGYLRVNEALEGQEPTRFPQWDRLVRYPLIWAGANDVGELFEANRRDDETVTVAEMMFCAWSRLFGDRWVLAAEVLAELTSNSVAASAYESMVNMGSENAENLPGAPVAQLKSALEAPSPGSKYAGLTAHSIGTALKRHKDRVQAGLKLEQEPREGASRKARRWRVVGVAGAG